MKKAVLICALAVPLLLGVVLSPPVQRALIERAPGAQLSLNKALFYAASYADAKQMRHLLRRGADPNWVNFQGRSVWHIAAQAWPSRSETIFGALDGYAPPWNSKNRAGNSVFADFCDARTQAWGVPLGARFERALREGADPNTVTDEGTTALILVARAASPRVTRALLQSGAQVSKTDAFDRTALDNVGQFIDTKICENAADCAAQQRDFREVARVLLEAGADPTRRPRKGRSPLEWARTHAEARALLPLLKQFAAKKHAGAAPNST